MSDVVVDAETAAGGLGVWSLAVLLAWASAGIVVTWIQLRGQRGVWPYLVLGALLGPLIGPALADRRDVIDHSSLPVWISRGRPSRGQVAVLVVTSSRSEVGAMAHVVRQLLGGRVGRIAFVRLVDDVVGGEARAIEVDEAAVGLEVDVLLVDDWDPDTVLLAGRDRAVVERFARDEGFDLVVTDTTSRPTRHQPAVPTLVVPVTGRCSRARGGDHR